MKGSDSFVKMRSARCKSSYCTSKLSPVSSSSCRHDTHTECICDANASALVQKNQRVIFGEISRLRNFKVCQIAIRRNFDTCCRSDGRSARLADLLPSWKSTIRSRSTAAKRMSLVSKFAPARISTQREKRALQFPEIRQTTTPYKETREE